MSVRLSRRARVFVGIAATFLALPGCAGRSADLCAAAGGTYEGGTCVQRVDDAAVAACERRGGMYLPGQNYCVFRGGGP
jgi:hypothetical protein